MKNTIIGDVLSGGNASQFNNIRSNARIYKNNIDPVKLCQNCGYDKKVEVHHIKALKEFALTSTIFEVNHKNNLIYLCPNCHWEAAQKQQ